MVTSSTGEPHREVWREAHLPDLRVLQREHDPAPRVGLQQRVALLELL